MLNNEKVKYSDTVYSVDVISINIEIQYGVLSLNIYHQTIK